MTLHPQLEISLTDGLSGDFRGRRGPRQVTVLSRESWEQACQQLQQELEWTIRRANLFIEGIELEASVGSQLRIGTVVLKVCGETDPCQRMDQQVPGLQEALVPHWRGGVCCQVTQAGQVALGDKVMIEPIEK